MRKVCTIFLTLTVIAVFSAKVGAQKTATTPKSGAAGAQKISSAEKRSTPQAVRPLVLTGSFPLPGVQGRFDHLTLDPHGRLFVCALGSNEVEVIDIGAGVRVHSISVPTPQSLVYSPEVNKLFVSSAKGMLYIYDGTSFDLITTIDFHGADVDNLRYDAANKRVYVGYGDDKDAAIGMIDATTNQRLDQEFKTGAHPESFQLETSGPNIYVNLPDLKQIAAINRNTGAISRWPITLGENFPMALDEADHRIFVGTHVPARLVVVDTNTGHVVAALPSVQNSDDLFYDSKRKRIYMAGGEGFIYVFQMTDPDHYRLLAKIPTTLGTRTAGYYGPIGKKAFDTFFLTVPARASQGAEVWTYAVQD